MFARGAAATAPVAADDAVITAVDGLIAPPVACAARKASHEALPKAMLQSKAGNQKRWGLDNFGNFDNFDNFDNRENIG